MSDDEEGSKDVDCVVVREDLQITYTYLLTFRNQGSSGLRVSPELKPDPSFTMTTRTGSLSNLINLKPSFLLSCPFCQPLTA